MIIPSLSVKNIITISSEKRITNVDGNKTYSFILKPENVGETELKLDFVNFTLKNKEIVKTITYKIVVDKNYKVFYEEIR